MRGDGGKGNTLVAHLVNPVAKASTLRGTAEQCDVQVCYVSLILCGDRHSFLLKVKCALVNGYPKTRPLGGLCEM